MEQIIHMYKQGYEPLDIAMKLNYSTKYVTDTIRNYKKGL